jgi:hypothetical protein
MDDTPTPRPVPGQLTLDEALTELHRALRDGYDVLETAGRVSYEAMFRVAEIAKRTQKAKPPGSASS